MNYPGVSYTAAGTIVGKPTAISAEDKSSVNVTKDKGGAFPAPMSVYHDIMTATNVVNDASYDGTRSTETGTTDTVTHIDEDTFITPQNVKSADDITIGVSELRESESEASKYFDIKETNDADATIKSEILSLENEDLFPFVCGICSKIFNKISTYITHFNMHKIDKFSERFLHICSIKTAIETESCCESRESFTCGFCCYVFPTMCTLHNHLVVVERVDKYTIDAETNTANVVKVAEHDHHTVDVTDQSNQRRDRKDKETQMFSTISSYESNRVESLTDINRYKTDIWMDSKSKHCLANTKERECLIELFQTDSDNESELNNQHLGDVQDAQKCVFVKNVNENIKTADIYVKQHPPVIREMVSNNNSQNDISRKNLGDNNTLNNLYVIKEKAEVVNKKAVDELTEDSCCDSDNGAGLQCQNQIEYNNLFCGNAQEHCDDKGNVTVGTSTAGIEDKPEYYNDDKSDVQARLDIEVLSGRRLTGTKSLKLKSKNHEKVKAEDLYKGNKHQLPGQTRKDCRRRKIRRKGGRCSSKQDVKAKVYVNQADDDGHLARNVSVSDMKMSCDVCGLVFKKRNLMRHRQCHTDVKAFECDICHKAFKTKGQLTGHKRHHRTEKNHVCDYCGKAFNNGPNLRQHIKTHTRERTLQCPLCPKKFCSNYVLKDHVMRHSDAKPHLCSVCGQAFKKKQEVTRHMVTHSDHRPHQCSMCNKGFKSRSNLVKHQKTHRASSTDSIKSADTGGTQQ